MMLKKLARMGIAEIADRSRQKATRLVDRVVPGLGVGGRRLHGLALGGAQAAEGGAALELFRDAAPRRFFPGVETGESTEILGNELPAVAREVIAVANAVCTRRFDLLGYEGLFFGESVDWHLDPVAGRRSPAAHFSRIDPLDPAQVGDSKVTWELNRHQWLLPLAQAYWLTADRRYAQEAADLVDDWSRANPYGVGLNWSSSLEAAFRLISWSWAFVLIRDAGVLSPQEFLGLIAQVRLHAAHIERYLSRYFSPNTHLTGEALGLFYAGVLFPELPEASRWRKLGRQILIDESRRQIHADGVFFEQATCYQRYTIDFYLHFLILAERNDVAVPADVRARVQRMLDFLLFVSTPDGSMPSIGDADGGWLLPIVRRSPTDPRGTFGVAAALFNRADYLWAAGGAVPEALWLLGPGAWQRMKGLEAKPPAAPPSALFPDGGYAVMRSDWGREAHQLTMDVGPLGCRFSAAHGHADLLSVQCTAFGESHIVDPGTYCYTPDRTWRDYFRGTAAHSTVLVDGEPQARPAGPFAWQAKPAVTIRSWSSTAESDLVDAFHDGYGSLPDPVRHRRRVLFVKPRFWVIVDDLSGGAVHDVELRFQFAADPLDAGDALWVSAAGRRGGGLALAAFADRALTRRVVQGEMSPPQGWISTHYGRRQAAPMVIYGTRGKLPLRITTVLLPFERGGNRRPDVTATHEKGRTILVLRESQERIIVTDDTLAVEPAPAAVVAG
jgi:hypothetical protein